jgi:hypothetical protein
MILAEVVAGIAARGLEVPSRFAAAAIQAIPASMPVLPGSPVSFAAVSAWRSGIFEPPHGLSILPVLYCSLVLKHCYLGVIPRVAQENAVFHALLIGLVNVDRNQSVVATAIPSEITTRRPSRFKPFSKE